MSGAAPPATAARTIFTWSSNIDFQRAPAQVLAIQSFNRLLRLLRRAHRHKGEPARPARGAIHDEIGLHNVAARRERVLQVVLGDFEVEVPDE